MNAEEMQSLKRSLDLLGGLRTYRGMVVVAHPRQASPELFEMLERLEARDVQVSIESFSPYFPDCFFSVVLWRPQDEELAREYLGLARERASWECERRGKIRGGHLGFDTMRKVFIKRQVSSSS